MDGNVSGLAAAKLISFVPVIFVGDDVWRSQLEEPLRTLSFVCFGYYDQCFSFCFFTSSTLYPEIA